MANPQDTLTVRPGQQRPVRFPILRDRDWLIAEYVTGDRSSAEIAADVGCDRKSVDNALKRLGIPMRPRGSHKNCRRFRPGDHSPFKGRRHTAENRRRFSERAKADGRRPYKPENGPPWKGKRGPAHINWQGGFTPERQAFYQTPEWKRAARLVWRRDRATCQRCGRKKCRGGSFDIHHIVPFPCRELRAVAENLVLLCERCHYWVHGSANVDRLFIKPLPDGAARKGA